MSCTENLSEHFSNCIAVSHLQHCSIVAASFTWVGTTNIFFQKYQVIFATLFGAASDTEMTHFTFKHLNQ